MLLRCGSIRDLTAVAIHSRLHSALRPRLKASRCGLVVSSSTLPNSHFLSVIVPRSSQCLLSHIRLSTTSSDETSRKDPVSIAKPTATPLPAALLSLSKARLSLLVVATTSLGFLSAGPAALSFPTLACATTGTAFCAASAATFNQVLEVDRDAKMKRTGNRVLVTGALTKEAAVSWGCFTGVSGALLLGMGTDPVTTLLGVGNIGLYSGLYTYMKPRSEWNTWVGAIVGALPPVMGWTAAGGSLMDAEAVLLGSTLFLWQFPHFFALNWMYRTDYKRGGFSMVAVNDENGDRTAGLIKRYAFYLASIPLLSSALEVTSPMFAVEGIVLNAYALHVANKFDKERSNANARKVFLTSLWYLPCVMMLFLLHSRQWHNEMTNDKKEETEETLLDSFEKFVHKIQSKGRDLCVHEAIASKDMWIGTDVHQTALDGSKCPLSLGKAIAKEGGKVQDDPKTVQDSC
ncbi:hypothetical protein HJC23_010438 [Cyclotella cryptica]|uniref:Heme O synthase n=1 Tax=Cyclotella cryptica TaxID=29204 RepID=A0ABD3QH69_9STRA|eukprot:CCRYP_005311-RA/>CCRYP_005311-RA protein AED:0.00 eAED:0.00 QI:150/-1/1/1/-1/1/1/369/460